MSNDNGTCQGCAENKLAKSSRALRESVAIVPYGGESEASVPVSMTSREALENMLELPSGVDGGQASANAGAPYEAPRVAEPITVSTIRAVMPAPLAQMLIPRTSKHIVLTPGGSDVAGYNITPLYEREVQPLSFLLKEKEWGGEGSMTEPLGVDELETIKTEGRLRKETPDPINPGKVHWAEEDCDNWKTYKTRVVQSVWVSFKIQLPWMATSHESALRAARQAEKVMSAEFTRQYNAMLNNLSSQFTTPSLDWFKDNTPTAKIMCVDKCPILKVSFRGWAIVKEPAPMAGALADLTNTKNWLVSKDGKFFVLESGFWASREIEWRYDVTCTARL